MSLSTTRQKFVDSLRTLTDEAYFQGTLLVASAHNMPVESFPWRFSSVISVGSHDTGDPAQWFYNPDPPVEFFAHGVNVEVGWLSGGVQALHREQLRHPAHRRVLRADPEPEPGAHRLPGQEPAPSDGC